MPKLPTPDKIGTVLGLQEISVLLEVTPRTPHAWKYRGVLPPQDHASVNGIAAWNRDTIITWAAEAGRLPEGLWKEARKLGVKPVTSERGGRDVKARNLEALAAAGAR